MRLFTMLLLSMLLFSPQLARADSCEEYGIGTLAAELYDPLSVESSGLAPSHTRPGVWFTHDDSGGDTSVYAFTADDSLFAEHVVVDGLFFDWEDMAAGPCPTDLVATGGERCLYIGDIGDNLLIRSYDAVFIVAEPAEGSPAPVLRIMRARFTDEPHDAETLFVHPLTGDVYVATKEADGQSSVWRFPPWSETETVGDLEKVADLPLADWLPGNLMTTGGDWDAEGERLVIRTYDSLLIWETDPCLPDAHWETPPLVLPKREGENGGEAVAFDLEGNIWTTAEGSPLPLSSFACIGYADHPLPDCGSDDTGEADEGGGDGSGDSGGAGGADSGPTPDPADEDSGGAGADGASAGGEGGAPKTDGGCGCRSSTAPAPPLGRALLLALGLGLLLRTSRSSRRSRSRPHSSRA